LEHAFSVLSFFVCLCNGTGGDSERNRDRQDHHKPAVGDAVTLLEPMSGMSEIGHATTNAQGHYSLDLPGQVPYLVRVMPSGR